MTRDRRDEDIDVAAELDRGRRVPGREGDPSPTPDSAGPMEEFISPSSSSSDPPLPPPPPEDARDRDDPRDDR